MRFVLASCVLGVVLAACGGSSDCPVVGEEMCTSATGVTSCVDTITDTNHCGGCGMRCGSGQTCVSGSCRGDAGMPFDAGHRDMGMVITPDLGPPGLCMPSCSASQLCCGTDCVARMFTGGAGMDGTTDTSFGNCGSCGNACDTMTASRCGPGTAGVTCMCGAGPACSSGQRCTMSATGYACTVDCAGMGPCATGNTCCGTGSAQACTDTLTDDANCGTCGHACSGTQACTAGTCVDLCGGAPCRAPSGTDLGEICCGDRCIPQDDAHCGDCSALCDTASGDVCGLGVSFTMPGAMVVCCTVGAFPICDFAGPLDGGVPDFGPPDLGPSDAGVVDADVDAGTFDADVDAGG